MGDFRRFDTSAVPRLDRFDFWREMVRPLRLDPITPRLTDFHVSAQVLQHGGVEIIRMSRDPAVADWHQETARTQNRLRLILLTPSRAGTASWHGQHVPLDYGCVALLGRTDGGWRAPAGLHGIEVGVPRAAVPVTEDQLATMNAPFRLSHDPIFTTLAAPALYAAGKHLAGLTGLPEADFRDQWVAIVTMLVRSVTGSPTDGSDLAAARRVQAEEYIRAHLSDPTLTAATIAKALRISRRTLYASMSSADRPGGIAAYIRAQRLQAAHALLSDPVRTEPIHVVAAHVGLPDAAHFAHLFTATYGYPPRELQARVRRAVRPDDAVPHDQPACCFERCSR